jgi:hypothetical protein
MIELVTFCEHRYIIWHCSAILVLYLLIAIYRRITLEPSDAAPVKGVRGGGTAQ